jgi:hypothetical protein
MRASRGLLATLGVSTCLVMAGTLALLSVSAVVAFKGWPGLSPDPVTSQPTQLAEAFDRPVPPARVSRNAEAIMIAPKTAPAAHRSIGSSPTQARYSGRIREVAEAVQAPAHPPTVAHAPTGPVEQTRLPYPDPPQVQETVKKVGGELGAAVKDTGRGLGSTVQDTGKKLSDGVQPISPELARTIENVTKTVGDVVNGLGGNLAGVLGVIAQLTR